MMSFFCQVLAIHGAKCLSFLRELILSGLSHPDRRDCRSRIVLAVGSTCRQSHNKASACRKICSQSSQSSGWAAL